VTGLRLSPGADREPCRNRPTALAASKIFLVTNGSWVGLGDHTHADGGFRPPRISRPRWPRFLRFQTMYPVCFGLSNTSRTLPAVHAPTGRRPSPRIGSGGGYRCGSMFSRTRWRRGRPVDGPPQEDLGHDRSLDRVGEEPMFGLTFPGFGLHRVFHLLGKVTVRGFADVVALRRVDLQTAPGQFEHVQDVPLGDRLLDPPRQRRCRLAIRGIALIQTRDRPLVDAFVGGEERDTGFLQLEFNLCAEVRHPRHPVDRLDHDRHEPAVRAFRLGEKISDGAVAGDRNVEVLVGGATARVRQGGAAGFDVVELRHDHKPRRQRLAGVVQLPWQRQSRILRVVC
jgi:hypothetical protein